MNEALYLIPGWFIQAVLKAILGPSDPIQRILHFNFDPRDWNRAP